MATNRAFPAFLYAGCLAGRATVAFAGASSNASEGIIVAPLDGSGAYRLVAPGAGGVLGWLTDGRILWTSVTGGT